MKQVINCRRSVIALTGITACVILALHLSVDTSGAIAIIVTSIAGANAAQSVFSSKPNKQEGSK